jgi:hypothetical protein
MFRFAAALALASLAAPVLALDSGPMRAPVPVQGTAPPDTLTEAHGWATDLVGTVSLAQAAYSNWQEGGVDALAATANLAGRFARVSGPFRQRHDSRLAFGIIQQDTLTVRKALDVIRYAFDLQYDIPGDWLPTFATELRTQFASGFDYDPDPARYPELAHLIVPGERLKVSDFFAPANWMQSLGMAYEPESWFRARAGLALKQTIVLIERLQPIYGNRPGQPVRLQAGLDSFLEARGEPFENVRVQSRLTAFQAFTEFAEAAPDVLWENIVHLQVNRWLSVNGEVAALYDRDVLDRVQLKQTVALGISIILM